MKQGILANEQEQNRLRRGEKEALSLEKADFHQLMATPAFRRFFYRLVYRDLKLLHGYGAHDEGVYRHLGRTDAARELLQRCQAWEPEQHETMVVEQTSTLKMAALEREREERAGVNHDD